MLQVLNAGGISNLFLSHLTSWQNLAPLCFFLLPHCLCPPYRLSPPVLGSIIMPSFSSASILALHPSHLPHPAGWQVLAFKRWLRRMWAPPRAVPQGLFICCEGNHNEGRHVVFWVILILKCGVCFCFWSLWKSLERRNHLKSILPYIWANLKRRNKYCSNQRTRLPKGLSALYILILNFRIIKLCHWSI